MNIYTISLYSSSLKEGVSFNDPTNTKNIPNVTDKAFKTIAVILSG